MDFLQVQEISHQAGSAEAGLGDITAKRQAVKIKVAIIDINFFTIIILPVSSVYAATINN